MILMKTMEKQEIFNQLKDFIEKYYDNSFSRMVCAYIMDTNMTSQEVKELLETIRLKVEQS